MKEPARLSSEKGHLAEALNDLRTQTPGADRLARMARALAAQGVDVQGIDALRQPQQMPQPSAQGPSAQAPSAQVPPAQGKAGWSVSAKVGLGIGGVVALGLIALLGRGSAPAPSTPATPALAAQVNATPSAQLTLPGAQPPKTGVARTAEPSRIAESEDTDAPLPDAPAQASAHSTKVEPTTTSASSPFSGTPSPSVERRSPEQGATGRGASEPTRTPQREPSALEPSAPAESEISLLKRAREALAGNPATALALAEQHRELYASGRLAQEREVIAITALSRLGQPTSAQKRAERFERTYPGSAYLGQIRRIVGSD